MYEMSAKLKEYCDKSLVKLADMERRSPGDCAPIYNKALLYLAMQDFERGWPLFRYRLAIPECRYSYKHFPVTPWDGASVDGKHLLVWTDQGIGDQIMCCSMLADLRDKCASLTVICSRRLIPLMRRSIRGVAFHKVGEQISDRMKDFDFDYQLSMSDVGQITRTCETDFPKQSFLIADPEKVEYFRQRYSRYGSRIGLSWESQSKAAGVEKSLILDDMQPLFDIPYPQYFNMQYDCMPEDEMWISENSANIIADPEVDQLIDMDVFAAQLCAMDLVVSASSSMVHLAGALGVETYVMVPNGKGCHWYWTAERNDCIWYPSVHPLRAASPGDWSAPVARAAQAVREATCKIQAA